MERVGSQPMRSEQFPYYDLRKYAIVVRGHTWR
jgi:hypothetical protein